jgi:ferredoxin
MPFFLESAWRERRQSCQRGQLRIFALRNVPSVRTATLFWWHKRESLVRRLRGHQKIISLRVGYPRGRLPKVMQVTGFSTLRGFFKQASCFGWGMKTCHRCKSRASRERGNLCAICILICPKCLIRPRGKGAVWCLECLKPLQKKRRKLWKGRWYKSRTPLQKFKASARKALRMQVRMGRIQRMPCEVCGKLETEADHDQGYDKENRFKVRWLCREHHLDLERWRKYKLTKQALQV